VSGLVDDVNELARLEFHLQPVTLHANIHRLILRFLKNHKMNQIITEFLMEAGQITSTEFS